MKVILIPAFVLAAALTASCASKTQMTKQDWALAAQKAETPEAHEELAKHYDEVAQTMQADADQERQMLAEYQRRPQRYGTRIYDLRARSDALIRDFEKAASDSRQMADFHRQLAAQPH